MIDEYGDALEVEVVGRKVVGRDVLEVDLRPVTNVPWPDHDAGAHIDVWLPNGLIRQYSLITPARDARTARIAVLKAEGSRGGSTFIHERLAIGHRILVSEPKNTFPLDEDPGKPILIAGGIGVTPLLAMARALAAAGRDFEFHYQVRTLGRAAYADELRELVGPNDFYLRSSEDDGAFAAQEVLKAAEPRSSVYVCGPERFMDYVHEAATALGVADRDFHVEHFKHDADSTGAPFTITAMRSQVSVDVGPQDTPARALSRAGVFVPTACEQGVCGTCVVPVLQGNPDHRDVVLTAQEKQSGAVMTLCCSRAIGTTITVDL